jgi:hypothetical protein
VPAAPLTAETRKNKIIEEGRFFGSPDNFNQSFLVKDVIYVNL